MADTPPVLLTDQELKEAVTRFVRKLRHYYDPKRWGLPPKERPSATEYLDVSHGMYQLEKSFEEAQRIRWYEAAKRKGVKKVPGRKSRP